MSTNTATSRMAWQDRWSQPTLQQLMGALKAHQRRLFDLFMGQLDTMAPIERTIIWYGPAWKWTIHYSVTLPRTRETVTLCYLVPNAENPLVCVPLSDPEIDQLPDKRLSKFVKDGIKTAKCAVAIHWATWSPTSQKDVGLLLDLMKRKHKLTVGPAAPAKNAADN